MSTVRNVLQLMKREEQIIADAIKAPRVIPDNRHKIIAFPETTLGYGRYSIRLNKKKRFSLSDETIEALDDELEHYNITNEKIIAIIIDALEEMQEYLKLKLDVDREHYNRTKKRLENNADEIKQYGGNATVVLPAFPMEVLNGLALDVLGSISKDAFLSIIKLSGIYSKDAGKQLREKIHKAFFEEIEQNDNSTEAKMDCIDNFLEHIKDSSDETTITYEMDENDDIVKIILSIKE